MDLKKVKHRVHREIIMLKKKKNTEYTEKKNKNSVLSVVRYSGVVLCGLCGFYSFCFLIFDILFTEKGSEFQ
jgi:hypothetical protein